MHSFKGGKSFFSLSLSVIPSLKTELGSSLPTVFMVVEVMVFGERRIAGSTTRPFLPWAFYKRPCL